MHNFHQLCLHFHADLVVWRCREDGQWWLRDEFIFGTRERILAPSFSPPLNFHTGQVSSPSNTLTSPGQGELWEPGPFIGLVEEPSCKSPLCSVCSRTDIHWTNGAVDLTLRQKGLDHLTWSRPAGRTHFCSQSGKEKSRPAKQASIGRAFPCLPHLTHFSMIQLLQPPQARSQLPGSNWGSSSNCQEIALQTVTPWSEMKESWKVTDSTWEISHWN